MHIFEMQQTINLIAEIFLKMMFQISGLRAVNCTIMLESRNLNKNNSTLNVTDKNYLNNNEILQHAKIVEKLKRIYSPRAKRETSTPTYRLLGVAFHGGSGVPLAP